MFTVITDFLFIVEFRKKEFSGLRNSSLVYTLLFQVSYSKDYIFYFRKILNKQLTMRF